MTAKRHIPVQDETEIDMTPMLDIVFIMLIFFIVTTSFVKESGVTVSAPQASTASQQEKANIFIAITADGEIWIDRRQTEPTAVRGMIERLHAENPKGSIVIQADEESTNEMLVVVMEAAKQAGVSNVAIAALKD